MCALFPSLKVFGGAIRAHTLGGGGGNVKKGRGGRGEGLPPLFSGPGFLLGPRTLLGQKNPIRLGGEGGVELRAVAYTAGCAGVCSVH